MTTWFPTSLAVRGERPALVADGAAITYGQLAERVGTAVEALGDRRLVLLEGANRVDAVAFYLAALAAGHPLILTGAGSRHALERLIDTYDPDVVIGPSGDGNGTSVLDERRRHTRHDLHPDLALLLSTSGSTGSPKLVRLSRTNLQSNAEAIASYLGIGESDRAITSLPMAYCYGLSVMNSHLQQGASLVLTERSVIDPEFWDLLRRSDATSFAGVPYTFDLLDRVGFADMALPSLRYVTQAGGRLDPGRVRTYAELGRQRGWDFYVMYGQTEATARMTYLPPALAATRPESIGVAIPGGSIRVEPVPEASGDCGELVYRGPNVMLGYAESPDDLALGRTVNELRTGDLGRAGADGMYEIVGRRAQLLKIAGLRVDPQAVESLLHREGVQACAVGTDQRLVVFTGSRAPDDIHGRLRETVRLPAHALRVVTLAELPRTPNGKIDRTALQGLAASDDHVTPAPRGRDRARALRDLYMASLGKSNVTDRDSFSALGGDSLSYVEISLGLEEILGRLPDGWESMSVRELADLGHTAGRAAGRLPGRWRSVEMSVALRAVAIVLIVASHIGMIAAYGGAHVLMAVAGFNFARFRLTDAPRQDRVASQLRAVARIALPAMAWVAAVMLVLDQYELRHLLLVNALVKDELWGNLWFIELLVYVNLALAAVLAVPAIDRAERRWPFAVPIAVLGAGLVFRYELVDVGIPYTMPVLWLFAIGWAASRAEVPWQRVLVSAVALTSVQGYFDDWRRNALILVGVLLLVWIRQVRVPRALARAGGVLAGASLYIYLVHWEVWPVFEGWYGVPSLVASLAAGIALWWAVPRLTLVVAAVRSSLAQWSWTGDAIWRRSSAS